MQNWYNQARSKRLSDYKTSKVSGKSLLRDKPKIQGSPFTPLHEGVILMMTGKDRRQDSRLALPQFHEVLCYRMVHTQSLPFEQEHIIFTNKCMVLGKADDL